MAIVMLIRIILDNNAAHDKFVFSVMNVNVFCNTLTLKKSIYLYILQRAN